MLFVRRSDSHHIVENPHHAEKSLHGIFAINLRELKVRDAVASTCKIIWR